LRKQIVEPVLGRSSKPEDFDNSSCIAEAVQAECPLICTIHNITPRRSEDAHLKSSRRPEAIWMGS
jgi:hypothetical protein